MVGGSQGVYLYFEGVPRRVPNSMGDLFGGGALPDPSWFPPRPDPSALCRPGSQRLAAGRVHPRGGLWREVPHSPGPVPLC